jgi:hypothetical protein
VNQTLRTVGPSMICPVGLLLIMKVAQFRAR